MDQFRSSFPRIPNASPARRVAAAARCERPRRRGRQSGGGRWEGGAALKEAGCARLRRWRHGRKRLRRRRRRRLGKGHRGGLLGPKTISRGRNIAMICSEFEFLVELVADSSILIAVRRIGAETSSEAPNWRREETINMQQQYCTELAQGRNNQYVVALMTRGFIWHLCKCMM